MRITTNAFKSGIFSIKATEGEARPSDLATQLKILTPKQMLQRLPIVLAQVNAGNASDNLLIKSDKLYTLCIKQKKLLKKYLMI